MGLPSRCVYFAAVLTLFYFKNKKMGELDFVIEDTDGAVMPIEVKSGKDFKQHRALNNVLNVPSYNIQKAYVLHEGNLSKEARICYLPVYMAACL